MPTDLSDLSHLCHSLAGLPADVPLYVLPMSAAPRHLGDALAARNLGATGGAFDLYFRDCLPWQGRGPCLAVNDGVLRQKADAGQWMAGIAMHELAHVCERRLQTGRWYGDLVTHEPVVAEAARCIYVLSRPSPDTTGPAGVSLPPWWAHQFDWFRAASHLRARAIRSGQLLLTHHMGLHGYGIDPLLFCEGLGDEITSKHTWPLLDVLESDPPAAAVDYWNERVDPYLSALGALK